MKLRLKPLVGLAASIVGAIAAAASNGQVRLANTAGTAWNGRADLTLALPGGAPIVVPDVRWTARPWRLLLAELAIDLETRGPEVSGRASVAQGFATTTIRDAELTLPAAWFTARSPFLAPWGASGTVAATVRSLDLAPSRLVGDGEVLVRGVASTRIGALGDYRISAQPAGDATALKLGTTAGPLILDGAGELGPNGAFRVTGTARADSASRERLAPVLGLIGAPRQDGAVAFQWPLFTGSAPAKAPPAPIQKRGATTAKRGTAHG